MSNSDLISTIKFYRDRECKIPIENVNWDKGFRFTLSGKKEEILYNTVEIGKIATATFFVRNESPHRFGIQEFNFPDKRVKPYIESDWLLPMMPVKIVLSVNTAISERVQIIESAQFYIEGFFVIDR